jgi:hypothetical protein
LIEEYVEGQLYSHSAFIENGSIKYDFIVEEHCLTNPYTVDTSWIISNEDFFFLQSIRDEINKLIKCLNLCDGLVHTQFIVSGSNIKILEVTRRCPGDLYSNLVELSTGIPYSKIFVIFLLNRKEIIEIKKINKFVLRHTISMRKNQHLISFEINQKLRIIKFVPFFLSGQLVKKSPKGKVAILFVDFESLQERQLIMDLIENNKLFHLN